MAALIAVAALALLVGRHRSGGAFVARRPVTIG
jgi:hypothetical protein